MLLADFGHRASIETIIRQLVAEMVPFTEIDVTPKFAVRMVRVMFRQTFEKGSEDGRPAESEHGLSALQ
jgi:hypothetical protein